MRQQLEHANKQLDERTAELAEERQQTSAQSASAAQHAELMDKIQSLNLLRESNETLRRETEAYLARVKSLESRLRETEAELSPLKEQVRVMQAEVEARDRNISLLEEDNARWKTRTQQILQKYERIDPAELASLKEELEKIKSALAEAEKQRDSEKARANAIQTDLQDANTRVSSLVC
jgi:nucleoprotein TPR